jgi:predicted nucleic acid-binding Zn ribbon protein
MAGGRRKFPQQIGGTIQDLLAHLDSEGHFEIVRLVRLWPEVVGETIARRTEITGLKFHTAVVKVSGAMWIQELNLMKPQILAGLRDAMRNDAVRDLRFVQGRLSRRDRPRLRAVARGVRRSIDLPELKDPELRRAFESLIEAWGRSPR